MTITLDPTTSALLVIDVQNGLFSKPTPIYKEQELLENINSLRDEFDQQGGAVFFIQHSNQNLLVKDSDNWQFHPQLRTGEYDLIIDKTH